MGQIHEGREAINSRRGDAYMSRDASWDNINFETNLGLKKFGIPEISRFSRIGSMAQ
jgi:hypothetical protein